MSNLECLSDEEEGGKDFVRGRKTPGAKGHETEGKPD
jgi:hypothetical protein